MTPEEFATTVHQQGPGFGKSQLIDFIFDQIDDHLLGGDMPWVEETLKILDVTKMSITTMICILTITAPWKESKERPCFFGKVRDRIIELEGSSRLKGLLGGLD